MCRARIFRGNFGLDPKSAVRSNPCASGLRSVFFRQKCTPLKNDMPMLKVCVFLYSPHHVHSFSFSKDYTAQHPNPCEKDMLMSKFLTTMFSYNHHITVTPTVTSSSKTITYFSFETCLLYACFIVLNTYFD